MNEHHIDDFLCLCIECKASDLHVAANMPIMVRINGELSALTTIVLNEAEVKELIYAIFSNDQIRMYETNHELDMSYTIKGLSRFRVNVYRERGSVAAAFRVIPTKNPVLADLHMPAIVGELTNKQRGLILVTGMTGSGKSTTLAAMIGKINKERHCHILTIEDPIEYLYQNDLAMIHQRELGSDTNTFAAALKYALRQDPDVILVGEMRDFETMQLAISAAETGHLVFATVHANTAHTTMDRIIDVFPEGQQEQIRTQLSNSIEAVISQQLLPTIDGKGRVAAVEIMIASAAIRNLIRSAKTAQIPNSIETGVNVGMQSMDQSLTGLVEQGLISAEVAVDHAGNQENLKRLLLRVPVK